MSEAVTTILNKTKELEEELKNTGLWQKDMPEWVHGYDANNISNKNFAQFYFYFEKLSSNLNSLQMHPGQTIWAAHSYSTELFANPEQNGLSFSHQKKHPPILDTP